MLLEAALRGAAVHPASVTVMPTSKHLMRCLLTSMQQVLLLACPCAVAMARNSAGPSMSSVTNAIVLRFFSQPSAEVSSIPFIQIDEISTFLIIDAQCVFAHLRLSLPQSFDS